MFKILEHLRYLEKTHLLMSIHNICFLQVLTILSALGLKTKDVSHWRKGKFRHPDPINDKNFVCDFFLGQGANLEYGKCSKILNTFHFLFSKKLWVIRAGIHKNFDRKPNREDPDQTASSEAV